MKFAATRIALFVGIAASMVAGLTIGDANGLGLLILVGAALMLGLTRPKRLFLTSALLSFLMISGVVIAKQIPPASIVVAFPGVFMVIAAFALFGSFLRGLFEKPPQEAE